MRQKDGLNGVNGFNRMPELASELWSLQQQSLAALGDTVRRAVEGARTIAEQQAGFLSEAQRQLAVSVWRGAGVSHEDGAARASLDLARRTIDSSLAHALALAEIAMNLQAESFAIISRSMSEGIGLALEAEPHRGT
jgi:Phasin protein